MKKIKIEIKNMNPLNRLIIPFFFIFVIASSGIAGYMLIEGWSFIDALYMVVITLATVGFREVHDLTPWGQILTIGIILAGVSTVIYAAGQFVEMLVDGEIANYRRRRKMDKRMAEMRDHYIICGFGRVGHQVAAELEAVGIAYAVLDSKDETALELGEKNIPCIVGDITSDKILTDAGIKCAKGLIASADSDTANVFVCLSARVLNPNLTIIARASSRSEERRVGKES